MTSLTLPLAYREGYSAPSQQREKEMLLPKWEWERKGTNPGTPTLLGGVAPLLNLRFVLNA